MNLLETYGLTHANEVGSSVDRKLFRRCGRGGRYGDNYHIGDTALPRYAFSEYRFSRDKQSQGSGYSECTFYDSQL